MFQYVILKPLFALDENGNVYCACQRGEWVEIDPRSLAHYLCFCRSEDVKLIESTDPEEQGQEETYFNSEGLLIPVSSLAIPPVDPELTNIEDRWILENPEVLINQGIHENTKVNMMRVGNDKERETRLVSLKNLGNDVGWNQKQVLQHIDNTQFKFKNDKWRAVTKDSD